MFCQKCGKKLGDNDRFCDLCGTPVGAAAPNRQPQYQQPQYQQPQYQQPQYQQPPRQAPVKKPKSRGPVVAVILVVVALIIGGAVFALSMMGRTSFAEEFELRDWNWCELACVDEDYGTVRRARTYDVGSIDDLWMEMMDTEMRTSKKDLEDKICSGSYEEVYLMDESGDIWLWVAVTAEGDMVADFCGEVTSYTGAKELYEKLNDRLFLADSASLRDAIRADGWAGMAIYQYNSDFEQVASAFTMDPAVTATVVSRLRELEVKYGGGAYYTPAGYQLTLQLWDEADNYLYINVYDDGNADIPFGDWTYGFYDAYDLYSILIKAMMEIKLLQY